MPHLLTGLHQESHVEISQELFVSAHVQRYFLKDIIAGSERLVYSYDIKTKMQPYQWLEKGSPLMSKSKINTCVCV